jgi:hypothetical protein
MQVPALTHNAAKRRCRWTVPVRMGRMSKLLAGNISQSEIICNIYFTNTAVGDFPTKRVRSFFVISANIPDARRNLYWYRKARAKTARDLGLLVEDTFKFDALAQ